MKEPIILIFELTRKQMISANDRLHYQQKGKITRFLRELAKYEGQNTLKDWYDLPFTKEKPCKVRVFIFPPKNYSYDPPNWSPTSKALLDGLTDAEFWTDDNYNIIKEVSFLHGGKSGTEKYKIKLEITETNHE